MYFCYWQLKYCITVFFLYSMCLWYIKLYEKWNQYCFRNKNDASSISYALYYLPTPTCCSLLRGKNMPKFHWFVILSVSHRNFRTGCNPLLLFVFSILKLSTNGRIILNWAGYGVNCIMLLIGMSTDTWNVTLKLKVYLEVGTLNLILINNTAISSHYSIE